VTWNEIQEFENSPEDLVGQGTEFHAGAAFSGRYSAAKSGYILRRIARRIGRTAILVPLVKVRNEYN